MAGTPGTCGVGGWGGPLPGDPSNTSILSATPAFGGIDVSWTYPVTNPHALAYVLLYRSITSNFALAGTAREVTGSLFFDKLDNENTYYYWIRFVSVNGTISELIGPASAQAKPLIEEMIERLTGQIDAGVLATALRNKIDRVDLVALDLAGEVVSRENGETTLAEAMADVNAGVAQTLTFLANEQTSRVNGDSALATSISLVAVTAADNLAAATTLLQAEIDASTGGVTAGMLDTVVAQTASNLSAAQTALNASITTVDNRVTSLTSAVTTVESEAAGNLAAVQTLLTTNITTVDGKATAIGALYTAKVTVNGQIGGFGIYNDGTEVEAGFDVDRFWIGRTGLDRRKPFIIDGGIVYIDDAAIRNAAITWAKIGNLNINADGSIRSGQTAYDTGTGYWMGMVSGVPQMSMGSPTYGFTWDGTTFAVRGNIIATGNVITNAITVQNSAFTTFAVTSGNAVGTSTDNYFVVLSKTFSAGGGTLVVLPQIFGYLVLGSNTGNASITPQLYLDGVVVAEGQLKTAILGSYLTNDNENLQYAAPMDLPYYSSTPAAGTHTLELRIKYRKTGGSDDVRAAYKSAAMVILEFKR